MLRRSAENETCPAASPEHPENGVEQELPTRSPPPRGSRPQGRAGSPVKFLEERRPALEDEKRHPADGTGKRPMDRRDLACDDLKRAA